jgi:uncharacterized protein (TIGR02099 family)
MQSEIATTPPEKAPPSRRARLLAPFVRVGRFVAPWLDALEILAWIVFFAAALAFLALRYWLLPNVERYRGDIVAAAAEATGLKISVGAIEPDWSGFLPRLIIADVRVYDPSGREALVLPVVDAVISWRTLLHAELRLHSLAIDGPRMSLRRDRDGTITIAGIRLGDHAGDTKLADWILEQREIEVRNAEIGWLDEMRGAPPLALTQLNARLRNEDYDHSFGLSARPPAELGSALEVRAELAGGSVRQLQSWNGRVFAELGTTDLAAWRAWFDYPVDVRKGFGALRLWTTLVRGEVRRATADLALTNVVGKLAKDLPVLEVASVSGRLHGRQIERGYEFGARNLALASGRGPEMHATSFQATLEPAAAGRPQRGTVSADLIELEPLARLAEFLPFPADLRKLLADLAPQGNLLDARFEWSGELPDASSFLLKTRFEGMTMNAWRTVPGFSGLSGSIEASDAKGNLHLASQKATLDLPRVFPEPRIALDTLSGQVQWERPATGALAFRIAGLSYANRDLAGTAFGTYQHSEKGAGTIDLAAQLSRASAKNLARYLPLGAIMGVATREWLTRSIRAGSSTDVRLRLKGDLEHFPFVDPAKGQFQVSARVSGAELEYVPGWPIIEAIEGDLLFERNRMEIVGRAGTILGTKISNVKVSIPNLAAADPMLLVNGNADGPTAEFFKFIQASPVRRMIDGVTDPMAATGNGRLQLRLDLPLHDLPKSKVAGEYQFSGNTTTVDVRLPPIERASGRVGFTESSFTVHEARGQLFGGPVAIAGGTNPDGGITVTARGEATVAGMGALFDHPWRARLSGSSPYTANVAMKGGRTQISFETSLRGVASDLPPPLAKSAADQVPLRVDIFPIENRDRISVMVGKIATAEFLRAKVGNEMQVQRTSVALSPVAGEAMRVPERPGTTVYGSLPALDLDLWIPMFAAEGAGSAAAAPGAGVANLDLRLGVLDVQGKRLTNVSLRAGIDQSGWSASLNAAEMAGELSYRPDGSGQLVARLSHFRIPDDSPGVKAGEATKELPAIDLVAEKFTHRGKPVGRVEVTARHDGPNWRIDRLVVVNPEVSLSGTGAWRAGGTSRIALKLKLESSDVGKFLERVGYPDRVHGGSATLEGSLAWNGSPLALDYPSLSGELRLTAEKGEFPQITSGFGRVLSLLSLSFNDAAAKGMPFDAISSSFQVSKGVMTTKDLKIKGSAAEINMTGEINLEKETQNLHVKVVPSMRRGVTALATMVNPVLGIGVAIAQGILKEPVGQILAYEYAVSGRWDEPNVEALGATPRETNEAP